MPMIAPAIFRVEGSKGLDLLLVPAKNRDSHLLTYRIFDGQTHRGGIISDH